MTDYLEEALEHTKALLEEVQRLERPLSGRVQKKDPLDLADGVSEQASSGLKLAAGASGQTGSDLKLSGGVSGQNESTLKLSDGVSNPAGAERGADTLSAARENGTENQEKVGTFPLWGRSDRTEKDVSPLLDQLVRLERAASSWGSFGQVSGWPAGGATEYDGGQGGYPRALSGPGRGAVPGGLTGTETADWTVGSGLARTGALAADEVRWAERADRIFRRDSRRYDGGFYLY